jgi:arginyl-tRNA synthetase
MLEQWQESLAGLVRDAIEKLYGLTDEAAALTPPKRSLGDLAFPAAMGLARELKRNPREIATEILAEIEPPDFVREIRVEGAGYLNVFFRRELLATKLLEEGVTMPTTATSGKVIVEHTNINPNKAAHIGHLRNAVLGDVLASVLRKLGHQVEIQNYIDDTGVQLADVIVGFLDMRGLSPDEIAALDEPFDHYCWDLYAQVGQWYEEDAERLAHRRATLHQLESNEGERAEIGRIVARRVVGCHLATMQRLGIGYDLLTHEGAILELDFFSLAFEKLKEAGTVHLETSGKNEGCWVMPLSHSEEFQGLEDPDKVIVRSDGTVTYVGKDIAYQLWKFGLLGEDFGYAYWKEQEIWQTVGDETAGGEHPDFGVGAHVINVIDARQSYLQKIVRAGLEALGHHDQAAASIHFAYEMVSLSQETARQLGFLDSSEDGESASLEMSGRKGIGVKADDLLDMLESKSREEISQRNRDLAEEDVADLARQIATAALRFFMVKATTTRVIAFDLDEALSFEGETGPYLQYSAVRARNIRRKLEAAGMASSVSREDLAQAGSEPWGDDLWDLILTAAAIPDTLARAGESLELSLVARHALDLAQKFNAIYHRHPILQESDEALRAVRLAATQVFEVALADLAVLLGVPLPDRM